MARIAMIATVCVLALTAAACGGEDDEDAQDAPAAAKTAPDEHGASAGAEERRGAEEDAARPSGDAEADLQRAEAAFAAEDYDSAFALLESVAARGDGAARQRLERWRSTASRRMLASARRKLREAERVEQSPRAAVVQAQIAVRYRPTAEARAFRAQAQRALDAFHAREREQGLPPPDEGY